MYIYPDNIHALYVAALSGIYLREIASLRCNAALNLCRILNSTMLDDGIINAAERAGYYFFSFRLFLLIRSYTTGVPTNIDE